MYGESIFDQIEQGQLRPVALRVLIHLAEELRRMDGWSSPAKIKLAVAAKSGASRATVASIVKDAADKGFIRIQGAGARAADDETLFEMAKWCDRGIRLAKDFAEEVEPYSWGTQSP